MEHQSIIARQNEYERRISSAKTPPMGISGAQKRKKKKEKEELALDVERLKLGPTKLWTGLVVHHKDVFVSHVLSKLNKRRIGGSLQKRIQRVKMCSSMPG